MLRKMLSTDKKVNPTIKTYNQAIFFIFDVLVSSNLVKMKITNMFQWNFCVDKHIDPSMYNEPYAFFPCCHILPFHRLSTPPLDYLFSTSNYLTLIQIWLPPFDISKVVFNFMWWFVIIIPIIRHKKDVLVTLSFVWLHFQPVPLDSPPGLYNTVHCTLAMIEQAHHIFCWNFAVNLSSTLLQNCTCSHCLYQPLKNLDGF